MSSAPPVLVVGGTGVVGRQFRELWAERHPDVRLLVAGRDPSRDPSCAAVRVDVREEDPLAGLAEPVSVVVTLSGDPGLRLLSAALARSIPVVDPCEPVLAIDVVGDVVAAHGAQVPVVLPLGWAGSAAAVALAALLPTDEPWDHVDIHALLGAGDATGPACGARMVELHTSMAVWEAGRRRLARGFAEPRVVGFDAGRFRARRISSGEQDSLVESELAEGVAVRVAFEDRATAAWTTALVGSGTWPLVPRAARAALLARTGTGARTHEVHVTAQRDAHTRRLVLRDPAGRAHLTAASVVSQVERVLGLGGRVRPLPGISYPEMAPDAVLDLAALRQMGVEVDELQPREGSAG